MQHKGIDDLLVKEEHKARYGVDASKSSDTGGGLSQWWRHGLAHMSRHYSTRVACPPQTDVAAILVTLYPDHFSTPNRQQARQFVGNEQ